MNRKEAIVVIALLFGTFVTGAFADTLPTSPTRTTVQTTSVDIDVLPTVSGFSAYGVTSSGVELWSAPYYPEQNFTAAFSFAPTKGFTQVHSAQLTLIYAQPSNIVAVTRFIVQLNTGGFTLSDETRALYGAQTMLVTLPQQDLRVGANTISIALPPTQAALLNLYQVRLTVEYTFLG